MIAVREKRDIEWLVNWALEKQGVLRGEAHGGSSGPAWMTLGTTVSGGGGGNDGRWMHDDALVIGRELQLMAADVRIKDLMAMVVRYGNAGCRPEWGEEGCGKWQLVRKDNGKAVRRFANQRKGEGLLGFEFEFIGSTPEDVEHQMIQWVGWRDALAALRDRINPLLKSYEATGPAAPAAPWDKPSASYFGSVL